MTGDGSRNSDENSQPALFLRRKRKLRVLTVGDGDLTLSLALARAYCDHSIDLTASVLESTKERLLKSFPDAPLSELEERFNVPILHGIDATQLHRRQYPFRNGSDGTVESKRGCSSSDLFDLITFHHPHLGLSSLQEDEAEHALRHYELLCHYLFSAGQIAKLVHVCLCGTQPETWRLLDAARRQGMSLVEAPISTTSPFSRVWRTIPNNDKGDYQDCMDGSVVCTNNAGKADGVDTAAAEAEPHFAAPRRYRNGKLGSRHFLGKYGYRHRRSEGDEYNGQSIDMNVSGSMHYVFVTEKHDTEEEIRDITRNEGTDGIACTICGASFESKSELEHHMDAPSLPRVTKTTINSETQSQESSDDGLDATNIAVSKPTIVPITSNQEYEQHLIAQQYFQQIDQSWTVPQNCEDKRLRRFIHRHIKNSSKRQAEIMILAGLVLVNGTVALDSSRLLQAHDKVSTISNEDDRTAMNDGSTTTEVIKATGDIVVMKRFDNCLVVWKPSGVRSKGEFQGTLESSIPEAEGKRHRCLSAMETSCPGLCVLTTITNNDLLHDRTTLSVLHTMTILIHGHVPESWYPRRIAILTLDGKWKNRNTKKQKCDEDQSSSIPTQSESSTTFSIEVIPKESARCHHSGGKEESTAPSLSGLSTVEVVTKVPSSHSLCRFFRHEGIPIVGDSLCQKEYLTLKRSVRNRLKGKLMMGCYKVEIESSKDAITSEWVEKPVPDKLSARFWESFVQAEIVK
jgi:ribosomal protein S4